VFIRGQLDPLRPDQASRELFMLSNETFWPI
jgi:hypothetical protein